MTDDDHEAMGAMLHRGKVEAATRGRDYHNELAAENARLRDRVAFLERRLVSEEADAAKVMPLSFAYEKAMKELEGLREWSDARASVLEALALAEARCDGMEKVLREARGWVEYYNNGDSPVLCHELLARIDSILAKPDRPFLSQWSRK